MSFQISEPLKTLMKRMRVQSRQDLSGMRPRPPFDSKLLIPIALGVVSILGVGWIFFTNFRSESPLPATAEPTAFPSDSISLEAGTLTPSPSAVPALEETTPIATGTSPAAYPNPPTE